MRMDTGALDQISGRLKMVVSTGKETLTITNNRQS